MFGQELLVGRLVFVGADGQDYDSGQSLLKCDECWQLLNARRTPGSPEIEDNYLAVIGAEMYGCGAIGDREIGGRASNIGGVRATVASSPRERQRQCEKDKIELAAWHIFYNTEGEAKMLRSTVALRPSDVLLAKSLAKLWPHRTHESNCLKSLLCNLGLHRWAQLDLAGLCPDKEVRFCRWCSTVKVDGVVYDN